MRMTTLRALALLPVLVCLPLSAQTPDLKQLGQQRTTHYQAAMKTFADDKLLQKLIAEEAELGKQAAAAKQAGNTELAGILSKAQGSKHMEKRYYLCLLSPVFYQSCQAFNNADPGYIGRKTTPTAGAEAK